LKLERDPSHPSLLFTEDTSEGNLDEAVEILETSWKPLVSPADADWLKSEWTEEEEWLNSLQLPKEWLGGSYRSRSNTPTSSPVSIRRRKPRQKSGLAETERAGPQKTETGWYLLRSHHRALVAREVSMTLNNRNQSGFTSYIDLEPPPDQKEPEMETTPDLLPGEMVISQADRVCIYSTHSGGRKKRSVSGLMRSLHTRSYHGREGGSDQTPPSLGSVFSRSAQSVHGGSVSPRLSRAPENQKFKLKDVFTPSNGYFEP